MRVAIVLGVGASAIGCSAILGLKDVSIDDSPRDASAGDAMPADVKDTSTPKDTSSPIDSSDVQVDACAADTQNDGLNCGRCGHDCLGGACTKGKCQPVLLASQSNAFKGSVRVDQNYVYYAGPVDVFRVDKNGGSSTALTNANDGYFTFISDFQVTATDLYITVGGYSTQGSDGGTIFTHGRFVRCPLGGCGVNHVNSTSYYEATEPFELAVDPTGIFFSDYSYALWRCDSPACSKGAQKQNANTLIFGAVSDGTNLYFTDYFSKAIVKCPMIGCGSGPTYVGPVSGAYGIAVNATDVYAASLSDSQIVRIAKSGGASPFATGQTKTSKVIVDANYVFWTTLGSTNNAGHSSDGTLARCPIAGCGNGNVDLEVMADSQDAPERLAQDDAAVYWAANSGSGFSVWKIAK